MGRINYYYKYIIKKLDQKIQFKVAIIGENKKIRQWETLDRNSNRKYKVTQSVALKIEYSNPQGKAIPLQRSERSIKYWYIRIKLVINQPPTRTKMDRKKFFCPFQDAEHSEVDID